MSQTTQPQVAKQVAKTGSEKETSRQVKLTLTRISPWSVLKASFLLSVAMGIALVVAVLVTWLVLDLMYVWADLRDFVNNVDAGSMKKLLVYLQLPRILALTTVIAVTNVVVMSALSTIVTFIYNLVAALVGGVEVSLTDE